MDILIFVFPLTFRHGVLQHWKEIHTLQGGICLGHGGHDFGIIGPLEGMTGTF